MFYPKQTNEQFRFIDDVLEINYQSRCILSGPPCIRDFRLRACHVSRCAHNNLFSPPPQKKKKKKILDPPLAFTLMQLVY